MKAAMTASTHRKKFPQDGQRLLVLKDSAYQKMLDAIKHQLAAMTNTDFWQDRRKKQLDAEAAAKSQADVIKQLGKPRHCPCNIEACCIDDNLKCSTHLAHVRWLIVIQTMPYTDDQKGKPTSSARGYRWCQTVQHSVRLVTIRSGAATPRLCDGILS